MILSSYRPGAWFGIFGSATTLLLPGSEKARVASLWAAVDDGAGFEEVLDTLLQSGLGALSGFVLLSGGEGPTKLLARGPVVVTGTAAGEPVRIDGSQALTWVERTLVDVESLRIDVDEPPTDTAETDLSIAGGLVRVSRVNQPTVLDPAPAPVRVQGADGDSGEVTLVPGAAEPAAPEDDAPEDDVREDDVRGDAAVEGPPDTEPVDPPDRSGPLDVPIAPPDAWLSTPPVPAGLPPMPSMPPSPPTFAPPSSGDDEPATEAMSMAAEPADDAAADDSAAAAEGPDVIPDDAYDHDGLTRTGRSGEEFSRELPGIPGQQHAPRVVAPVARLEISNGESVEVDRVVLIGRAPEARRFASTDQPRMVKVPSPLHEISSTHIEVRPGSGADHGSAVVTDLGSTNGTVIEQPGLGAENLRPGIAVQLIPGATINLGDGVSIQVERP